MLRQSCGLIKDWKRRYLIGEIWLSIQRCGLIKDWKRRYLKRLESI